MVIGYRGVATVVSTGIAAVLAFVLGAEPTEAAATAQYDAVVLSDTPAAYWRMGRPGSGSEPDLSGAGLAGVYAGRRTATTLPNGETAAAFDGATGYLQVADHAALSPATAGVLTIEAWMRPDTLIFPQDQGTGYVHWMGKGVAGQHEHVARMYSRDNTEGRGNRISGYLFDPSGGRGAGSYFQDRVVVGRWIHYVLVINANARSSTWPNGYTKIYRDGVLRDQDNLSIDGNVIVPQRGTAPFRVGTRDFGSWFTGAVGKVAIYQAELPASRIARHHAVMVAAAP
jgi:hypothetical protein